MTLDEAKALVGVLRRHLLLARLSRVVVLILVLCGFLGAILLRTSGGAADAMWYTAVLASLLWILLTVFSVRQIRGANRASAYISSGRLDLAEEQLKSALRQFSLYRMGKLLACHNLAVVAHGQKDYQAAAALCGGVIAQGGGMSQSVGRLSRILLADCRLFLGDAASANAVIEPLVGVHPALSLAEQLMVLPIELRCHIGQERFEQAGRSLPQKVRLAELLDAPKASLVHALLAQACRQTGKAEAAAFLQRRAELYHDQGELAGDYQILGDWPPAYPNADNNVDN